MLPLNLVAALNVFLLINIFSFFSKSIKVNYFFCPPIICFSAALKTTWTAGLKLVYDIFCPVKPCFSSQTKSKYSKACWNEVSGVVWRVKVHFLMVDSQNYYLNAFNLPPVNKFKGRPTDMIKAKGVIIHFEQQLVVFVSNEHSPNGRHVIRVKFTQIWRSLFQWNRWISLIWNDIA